MTVSELMPLLALGGVVCLGSTTQRITGVGFALVAAPFITLLLGALDGVVIVNLFGSLTSLIFLFQVWRDVEYRKILTLLIPALICAVPGAIVVAFAPPDLLAVVVGGAVVVALTASLFARPSDAYSGFASRIVAGGTSGFMNVTAGVGGPAMTIYAVVSRWPQEQFSKSLQFYFFVLGIGSLLMKRHIPDISVWHWVACGVGMVLGAVLGRILAQRVKPQHARWAVIGLAYLGGASLLGRGILGLAGAA